MVSISFSYLGGGRYAPHHLAALDPTGLDMHFGGFLMIDARWQCSDMSCYIWHVDIDLAAHETVLLVSARQEERCLLSFPFYHIRSPSIPPNPPSLGSSIGSHGPTPHLLQWCTQLSNESPCYLLYCWQSVPHQCLERSDGR
jgi:hypothetical protein